ncbi:hypothetical protein BX600DRAFT_90694 [Xylariales sp. PMI_506]|nr:hypothetical protein BX600DRAFT_90694 [Xylariales sp. PMI_506]
MEVPPSCDNPPQYHGTARTVVESVLWVCIIVAYIPQYIRIQQNGTKGVSPYYVLNHCLFSTTTLALRLSHRIFFPAFNCVTSGALRGWKAYSALLPFLTVLVQWICAVVLLWVYVGYRTSITLVPLRTLSDWQIEETREHKLTSRKMTVIAGLYAAITLPPSLLLIALNANPYFDDDSDDNGGDGGGTHHRHRWLVVYGVAWSIWVAALCALDAFLVVFQFVKQMKTVGRLRTRGALSLVSVALLSAVLVAVALTQFYASRRNITPLRERHGGLGGILLLFGFVYGCVSVDIMYLVAGLGYLVLFQLCLIFDWNDLFGSRFGRIQLL